MPAPSDRAVTGAQTTAALAAVMLFLNVGALLCALPGAEHDVVGFALLALGVLVLVVWATIPARARRRSRRAGEDR